MFVEFGYLLFPHSHKPHFNLEENIPWQMEILENTQECEFICKKLSKVYKESDEYNVIDD